MRTDPSVLSTIDGIFSSVILNEESSCEAIRLVDLLKEEEAKWQELLFIMEINNLVPLLFHRLDRLQLLSKVPQAVREFLSRSFSANRIKNFLWKRELAVLLEHMNEVGVAVTVLKGAVSLYKEHYRHAGCRAMNDMDILIQLEARPLARSIMEDLGYCRIRSDNREDLYSHPKKKILIEIHNYLFDAYLGKNEARVLNEACWDRKLCFTEVGLPRVYTLFPEDQIFFHIYHAFVHHLSWFYESLGMFSDFIALCSFYGKSISIDDLLENARKVHLESFFISFLYILEKKTGRQISDTALPASNRLKQSLDNFLDLERSRPERHLFLKRWLIVKGFDEGTSFFFKRIYQLLRQDLPQVFQALFGCNH